MKTAPSLLFSHISLAILRQGQQTGDTWDFLFFSLYSLPFFYSSFSVQLGARLKNPCRDKTENSSGVRHVVRTWHLDLPRTKTATTSPEISHFQQEGGAVHVSIDENVIRDKPIFLRSVVDKYCPILHCQSPSAIKRRPRQPPPPPSSPRSATHTDTLAYTRTYRIKDFIRSETQRNPSKV